MDQHLIVRYELNQQDIAQIHQLEDRLRDVCGMHYKLDLLTCENTSATNAHILCHEGGRLVGYIALSYFGHDELEMTMMMENPRSYFHDVCRLATDKCAEIGARRLLLINDRNDLTMAALATGAGMVCSATEYRMSFQDQRPIIDPQSGISLRNATVGESAYIVGLDNDSFHNADETASNEQVRADDLANTRIAERNGVLIGKIRIDERDGVFGIYGFVVAPEHRGKGYGRAILSEVLHQISSSGYRKIYLEVAADNPAALHLYESSGFHVDAAFDYYEKPLVL